MRYRVKTYIVQVLSADGLIQVGIVIPPEVYNTLTVDTNTGYLDSASLKYVTESIRLIADETRGGYVLMSTGQKGVIDSVYKLNGQAIAINIDRSALTTAADGDENDLAAINAISASDQFTIAVDWGTQPEELAKQSTLATILGLLQGDDAPEELPEGVGDRLLLLLQHFGIAGSYEAEAKGGERTNNTVIDECKVRFQEAFNGLLPTGFTMPNSVTVDNLTYTGTTNS